MAPAPKITDTWAVSLVLSAYTRIAGIKPDASLKTESDVPGVVELDFSGEGTDSDVGGFGNGAQPASKAGGKRRKTTTKKK